MPTVKSLMEQQAALADDQVTLVEDRSRPWSEKTGEYEERQKDLDALTTQIKNLTDIEGFERLISAANDAPEEETAAKSLGEHFAKSDAYKSAAAGKSGKWSVTADEFLFKGPTQKAAGDPFVVGANSQTQYGGVTPVQLQRPTVADLFAQGTLSASSLTYWVGDTWAGDFDEVAEGALKPGMTSAFHPVTEGLHKIAGWHKFSDESLADVDYSISAVNAQLIPRLQLAEERKLLSGTGASGTMRGVLNVSGIQTQTSAGLADNLEAIFRATTQVQVASFLVPDAIVMHPTNYQSARLAKDANGQYYAGGPFFGEYGVGGVPTTPPVWGYRTIVTTQCPLNTVLVGNFGLGGQVFRKGGITVDMTNSDGDDFKKNIVTMRAEERLLLAVYLPLAFSKLTWGTT